MEVVPRVRGRGRDPHGRRAAEAIRPQRGQRAVTHVVDARRQRGERALLDLVLETGRTHQARVQLAHAGAPIAGDVLYGGSRCPAVCMLHAAADRARTSKHEARLVVRDDLAPRGAGRVARARRTLGYAIYDERAALDRGACSWRWSVGGGSDEAPTAIRRNDARPRFGS